MPFIGALIAPSRPALRDDPAEGVLYLPQFAPPERFVPPAPERNASALKELSESLDVGRPALLTIDSAKALGDGAAFDFMTEAAEILGKSFDIGACEGAKQRLAADAWALDAMIDYAFCKAADGALEEADADFERLLAYTPDNYEALVGRGLIAIAQGEREGGMEFFQEALNALPPIAESDRIVAAMDRN
jgi:tetratricopeptide (TPR) repeat protein